MEQRLSWLFVFFIVQYSTAAVFNPGNLLVTRSGTNSAALQASNALFVDEIALNGTLIQSIPLGCVVGNTILWGALQTSTDELYASAACYPGSAGSTAPSSTDRLIQSVKADGTIVSTVIQGSLSARTPFSAVVVNVGIGFIAGIGTSSGMLAAASLGQTTGGAITGTNSLVNVPNTLSIYNVQVVGDQSYISALGVTTPFIVASISGGFPLSAATAVTSLFDASTVSPPIPSSFGTFVWNSTQVYGTSSSTLWRASYDGVSWTSISLTIATPANGITVRDIGNVRTIFYTLESGLYRTTEVAGAFTTPVLVRSLNSGKARYHDVTTVPNACVDGQTNLAETDTDCGGPICGKCATTKTCSLDRDCSSTYCAAGGVCTTPTCNDGVKNNQETGIDCGGPNCGTCSSGGSCTQNSDCVSNSCLSGTCQATCSDTEKNQGESDTDCGGPCSDCAAGRTCNSGSDCVSGVCGLDGKCQATCSDNVQNQGETDTDCGGPNCSPCRETKSCFMPTDCYGDCILDVCVATCTDTFKNQGESDIDCGGDTLCGRCNAGLNCTLGSDCKGGECAINGTCTPNCKDSQLNNGESDTDCGGNNSCNRCATGGKCNVGSDCGSGVCDGTCSAPTCWDGVTNGGESDIDCGGPCGSQCSAGGSCNSGTDCVSGVCSDSGICQATCSDGVTNNGETDTDCGGPNCAARCSSGKTCNFGGDCRSGQCGTDVGGISVCIATCSDNEKNQGESDTDCGGENDCPRCREDKTCLVGDDCISTVCQTIIAAPAFPGGRSVEQKAFDGIVVGGVCMPTCSDGFLNNGELDTDCGGPNCADCIGKNCGSNTDCPGSFCNPDTGLCKFNCFDELLNNGETDVDCGGPSCNACNAGFTCTQNSDCVSKNCTELICLPACDDNQKNGNETDIDCGGDSCSSCSSGMGCLTNSDCKSNQCNGTTCLPTCNDGEKNQGESDTDCGSVCGGNCAVDRRCDSNSDCASKKCSGNICVVSCLDGALNNGESDVDCGGSTGCNRCGLSKQCDANSDCKTGLECNDNTCAEPAPIAPPVPEPVAEPVAEPIAPPVDPPVNPPVAEQQVSDATKLVGAFVMFIVFLLA